MKSVPLLALRQQLQVAPFAGAWIEILLDLLINKVAWSLPSRERGLKSHILLCSPAACLSLPSRERGLKFENLYPDGMNETSLPSRERGLKWDLLGSIYHGCDVAPFAGAWIEILLPFLSTMTSSSLPSRERGLKSDVDAYGNVRQSRSLRGSVD